MGKAIRQNYIALWHPDQLRSLIRRQRLRQCLGICKSHVFASLFPIQRNPSVSDGTHERSPVTIHHSDESPRDKERVVAAFQHPSQPIERCVCVAAANGFVQRRDGVVVVLHRCNKSAHTVC